MLCMREARIRTFMQLELEACQEEIVWMITCHNCEALNRPLEEYRARPLPIPPNYIDNLHSRLLKVQQGVLPPTLEMILKIRYNLPPATTSPRRVQPDDVMRRHRDGENSPQERPRATEEKEEVVVNGTLSTNEGGDSISETKVETDHELLQVADRHFNLVIFRQQKVTTAKSTDWAGDYTPFTQTSRRTRMQLQQHESPPARRLRLASNGKRRHRLTRTSSTTPAARVMIRSFLPSGHAVYCILCCAYFRFVLFCLPRNFPCYHIRFL